MANDDLLAIIKNEPSVPDIDGDSLDRILKEPHQQSLAEAIAADAVDLAPVVGDLSALARAKRADEMGVEFSDQPAYIEAALSDLPTPVGEVAAALISENVLLYLKQKYDINLVDNVESLNDAATENYAEIIDTVTP